MAARTNAARPAAGPLTLRLELLNEPITIPPIIPDINPLKKGAPDANEIPRQSGNATRKTTRPDGRSFFKYFVLSFICVFLFYTPVYFLLSKKHKEGWQ
jgi:hypothetical protein